jgi:transposase
MCARRVAISSDIESKLEVFERRILAIARNDEVCRRLMTVQSIGPFIATALTAAVGDPRNFASGRRFRRVGGVDASTVFNGRKRKAWRN